MRGKPDDRYKAKPKPPPKSVAVAEMTRREVTCPLCSRRVKVSKSKNGKECRVDPVGTVADMIEKKGCSQCLAGRNRQLCDRFTKNPGNTINLSTF